MGVTGNVRSGWGNFHSNIQLPCSVQKGGGGSYKKRKRKKEEVQHAMKNMIPESNGKDRTLKEEEEGS